MGIAFNTNFWMAATLAIVREKTMPFDAMVVAHLLTTAEFSTEEMCTALVVAMTKAVLNVTAI